MISALVAGLWWSGTNFPIDWNIIIDVSPWALTFYCITLIGATMNDLWPELGNRPGLGVSLMMAAVAVALYAAFIVIWRHNPEFTPGTPVYVVTFILLLISIVLCHRGARN